MSILALVRSRLESAAVIIEITRTIAEFRAFLEWLTMPADEGFDVECAARHHEMAMRERDLADLVAQLTGDEP